jgi:endo-1,4-beta-mannosidase
MWQHIVSIFRNAGATNVKFWFSVGDWINSSYPISAYYPGDTYVDYIGFEIYNFRTTTPFDDATHTYGSSTSAVQAIYTVLCAVSSVRPMVLAEIGCLDGTSDTTAKPAWLTNVLNPTTLKSLFPRLVGLMYWDDESNSDGTWGLRNTVADQTAAINAFKLAGFKNGI